jgi:hypothetical protein
LLPIDFALSPRDFIFGRPKEGSLKLIDGLQGTVWYCKGRDVVDRLRRDDRFNEGASPGRCNEFPIPRCKLGCRLINKGLHINHLETSRR